MLTLEVQQEYFGSLESILSHPFILRKILQVTHLLKDCKCSNYYYTYIVSISKHFFTNCVAFSIFDITDMSYISATFFTEILTIATVLEEFPYLL